MIENMDEDGKTRDACSWKGQLESFAEVGKSEAKLEKSERSWKEPTEVGKL